jgi:hypothetical protein
MNRIIRGMPENLYMGDKLNGSKLFVFTFPDLYFRN